MAVRVLVYKAVLAVQVAAAEVVVDFSVEVAALIMRQVVQEVAAALRM